MSSQLHAPVNRNELLAVVVTVDLEKVSKLSCDDPRCIVSLKIERKSFQYSLHVGSSFVAFTYL